jgi:TonB family protein
MKTIYLAAAILAVSVSFAQDTERVKAGFGVTVVQTQPEFPGGPDSLQAFLSNNLTYPREAKLDRINGRVYISFVIDEKGKINNPKVLSGVNSQLDDEALRVVKLMPDWKPGTKANEPVKVQYILPIDFITPKKAD